MSYITTDNLNSINAELSNYCNAACPMCNRYDWDLNLVKGKVNNSYTKLDVFVDKIGVKIVKQLKKLYSCGTYGDPATNPECLEIFEFLRRNNPNMHINMHSNGGTRSKDFWRDLAKLHVDVVFAIDGLEHTNHMYRRNVNWTTLMDNVKSYINAGGNARWQYLIFKHNQAQESEAKELSKKLGFVDFYSSFSTRWTDFNSDGEYRDITSIDLGEYRLEKPIQPKKIDLTNKNLDHNKYEIKDNDTIKNFKEGKINCASCYNNNYEIYIMANGYVSPCCYIGDLDQHEPKNIIKDYEKVNINYTSLAEILEGDFFRDLANGIAGRPGSHRLQSCWMTCGVK
jgi:MoaA/NifB/PqqE/SkfB family radical SAM enzyme